MTANPFAINPGNDEILTHLDDAVAQLGETDRDAIIGRYFLSQSMDQIGETLGINSKAAAKRVSRALEKLHSILTRKGVSADQAALSALLPMIALQPHASSTVISNVLSGSSSAASVNALLKTAATSKSATLVASVIATVLLAATTTIAILSHHPRAGSPLLLPVAQAAIPVLAANPPAAPDNEGRTVTLIMVDPKTNAPIKNAQVEVKEQNNPAVTEPADENGTYVLHLPPTFQYVRVRCLAPGRSAMELDFTDYTFKGDPPKQYTIPMDPGVKIGGVVKDENGAPLAGAKVRLSNIYQWCG